MVLRYLPTNMGRGREKQRIYKIGYQPVTQVRSIHLSVDGWIPKVNPSMDGALVGALAT